MSKQDCVFVAQILKSTRPTDPNGLILWGEIVKQFARQFSNDNPEFDFESFYDACIPEIKTL